MAQQEIALHAHAPARARTFSIEKEDEDGTRRYMGFERDGYWSLDVWKPYETEEGGTPHFVAHTKLYKSVNAALNNCGFRSHMTREQRAIALAPLIVIFDPDNLEPVNLPATERADWYHHQIVKWRDKLFASGDIPDEKIEALCEALILDFEVLLRKYRARQAL